MPVPDGDQTLRLLERQRSQQDRLDDADDGRRRADAKRERQHDSGRRRRGAGIHAQPEAHVLDDPSDGPGPVSRLTISTVSLRTWTSINDEEADSRRRQGAAGRLDGHFPPRGVQRISVAGGRVLKGTTAAAFAAFSLLTGALSTRVETFAREQGKAAADVQPIAGEWRSTEQFDNRARATLAVQDGAGGLTGPLTLVGMTRAHDDRATLHVPFRDGAWDGTTLSFATVLPDGEGTARWALRVTAPGKATLGPLADDGRPEEGGPKWEMIRRCDRRGRGVSSTEAER